jgi:putative transposase
VRAGLVERAEDYRWSSAPAHCGMASDALLRPIPGADVLIRHWSGWLAGESDPDAENLIRTHTFSGRPMNKRGQSPVIQNE